MSRLDSKPVNELQLKRIQDLNVAKGYLNKHIAFFYDHGIADKTEESLRDMVVYGLIMLYMVKKHKEWLAQVKE